MAWFSYNPSPGQTPLDQASYDLQTSEPPCVGTYDLCAIQTSSISGQPDLNQNIRNEMILALAAHESTSNVKLKD